MAAYLAIAWLVLPPEALWSPDEGCKLLQTRSLRVENMRIAYDIIYGARDIDPDLTYARIGAEQGLLQVMEERLYFRRLPLFPLLTRPLLAWLGLRGLYLLPALGGALLSVLPLLMLPLHERRSLMWVATAWASPVLIYAVLYWEHTPAAALALGAVCLATRTCGHSWRGASDRRAWIAVGLLLSAGSYLRLEQVILAAALVLACWWVAPNQRRGAVWAVVTFALTLAPYFALHSLLFQQPVPDNAKYLNYPLLYLSSAGWRALQDLLVGPFREEAIDPGWLGGLWTLAAGVAFAHGLVAHRSRAARTVSLVALIVSMAPPLVYLLTPTAYRSAHGLLFTTPWALFALCRAGEVWRRGSPEARIVVLTVGVGLLGYAASLLLFRSTGPQGGLEWGARFAMVYYPLLAVLAGYDMRRSGAGWLWREVAVLLVVLGIAMQGRGLYTIREDKRLSAQLNAALMARPARHVLSELWWMPLSAAPIAPERAVSVAPEPEDQVAWLVNAYEREVRDVVVVTLDPGLPEHIVASAEAPPFRVVAETPIEPFHVIHIKLGPP